MMTNTGVIVVGYPGIGKTTLSNSNVHFIDLESNKFYVKGERDDRWYIPYCEIAMDLASQGYCVFVSSHIEVQKYLLQYCISPSINLCACVPSLELKDEWLFRLSSRYDETQLSKDYNSLRHVTLMYEEDITEIHRNFSAIVEITSASYDLRQLLEDTFSKFGFDVCTK